MSTFPEKLLLLISRAAGDKTCPIIVGPTNFFGFKEGVTKWDGLIEVGMRTNSFASFLRNLNFYGFAKNKDGWYVHISGRYLNEKNLHTFKRRATGSGNLRVLVKKKRPYDEMENEKNDEMENEKNDDIESIDSLWDQLNGEDDLLLNMCNIQKRLVKCPCSLDDEINKTFKDPIWLAVELNKMDQYQGVI